MFARVSPTALGSEPSHLRAVIGPCKSLFTMPRLISSMAFICFLVSPSPNLLIALSTSVALISSAFPLNAYIQIDLSVELTKILIGWISDFNEDKWLDFNQNLSSNHLGIKHTSLNFSFSVSSNKCFQYYGSCDYSQSPEGGFFLVHLCLEDQHFRKPPISFLKWENRRSASHNQRPLRQHVMTKKKDKG